MIGVAFVSAAVGFYFALRWRELPVVDEDDAPDPRTQALVETNRMLLAALLSMQSKEPRATLVTAERLARPASTLNQGIPESVPEPTPAEQARKSVGGTFGVRLA